VLGELLAHGGDPTRIAATLGFEQLSSDSLGATVASLIDEHPTNGRVIATATRSWPSSSLPGDEAHKGQANGKAVIAELQARRSSRRLAD